MQWVHEYQLFLFDFDGLLVNTEELHFLAYKQMCANRGIPLNWSFDRYCQAAHYEAHAVRDQLYAEFPELQEQEPNWNVLYAEKKAAIHNLLLQGAATLMPGVENLLTYLSKNNLTCCVVTHSPSDLISIIRKQYPILDKIRFWVTREHYSEPKPSSECYIKAIETYAKPTDKVIGFEDTPRGLTALLGTRAQPVLICKAKYPEISDFIKRGVIHFESFTQILDTLHIPHA